MTTDTFTVPEFHWPTPVSGMRCLAPDCPRPIRARGMCRRHYDSWYNRQKLDPAYRSYGRTGCIEPGCGNAHQARGYCSPHYMRHYRDGTFTTTPRPRLNH